MSLRPKIDQLIGAKKALTLFDEFKNFAFKGNVIDLAVGVIIGSAFGKIIDSLVKHLIMPGISLLLPAKQDYLGWKLVFHDKAIPYGLFLGEVVNFLIIACVLYIFIVKFLGFVLKNKKEEATKAAPPSVQEVLLAEIRDILKNSQGSKSL